MIEMKNVREWMFPRSHQLFQVLSKAADLQTAHPEAQILPMVVCRRKHIQSIWMANDLGFALVEVKRAEVLNDLRAANAQHPATEAGW